MALPKYTRRERKPAKEHLPKDAYVVKIVNVKQQKWPSGDEYLEIAYDIAEGKYAGFYNHQYQDARTSNENAVWPYDARYNLNIPNEKSDEWVWNRYNEFFTFIEDSNNGYIFSDNLTTLRGKLFGGKFRTKQSKSKKDGKVYSNTELRWPCDVEEVRSGKAAESLPDDYIINGATASAPAGEMDGFVNLPTGTEEEVPFI